MVNEDHFFHWKNFFRFSKPCWCGEITIRSPDNSKSEYYSSCKKCFSTRIHENSRSTPLRIAAYIALGLAYVYGFNRGCYYLLGSTESLNQKMEISEDSKRNNYLEQIIK